MPPDASSASASPFYIAGGTLPREAPSYVARQADTQLLDGLKRGEFCYILTARQMGKSSLMVRTAARLKQEGVSVAVLDLTAIGQNLTPEQWYDGLLSAVGRQLHLEDELDDFWLDHERLAPMRRFFAALREVVLEQISGSVVLLVDEVDAVRSLPFSADEFFAGIRECFNRRVDDVAMQRLTFALFGVASPSDLIRDTRLTPFNIGTRIELRDFTPTEAKPLAAPVGGEKVLERILYWTSGHPYLTQRLCKALTEEANTPPTPARVDALATELFLSSRSKETDDNLLFVRDRLLRSEVELAGLLTLYSQVRSGKRVRDEENNPFVSVLRLSGIVKVEHEYLKVRNMIYAVVFDQAWIRNSMPDAELRRQQAAYERGVLKTGFLAGVVLAIVSGLALYAFQQRNAALDNARRADSKTIEADNNARTASERAEDANHFLYIANMNLIQHEWENNNTDHVLELLEETRAYGQNTFEWGYWHRLCHLDLLTLKGHTATITSMMFSQDGKRIVTGSDDRTAKVWDATTGKKLLTLQGHTDRIISVVFSPDGKRIITGSTDKTAKVWDAATGKELLTFKGYSGDFTLLAFSLDGTRVATADNSKIAKVWNTATGKELLNLKGHTATIKSVMFSPDGKRIVTISLDQTARVWDAITGEELLTLKGHMDLVNSVVFSPDGKRIATQGLDAIEVWDAATGKELLTLDRSERFMEMETVRSIAFSLDGKRIVTGSDDRTAKVWDATTGKKLLTLQGHTDRIISVVFSPDGRRIATGSDDATIKIWDITTRKKLLILRGHRDRINSVAFSPNSNRIVTSGYDNTARVWNASTGKQLLILKGHKNVVSSANFSPNGNRIVTGSWDHTARIWDATRGKELLMLKGHTAYISSVAFSPDGKRIVSGSDDRTAKVWDATTGKELLTLQGHTDLVNSVVFSPDGKRIATGSNDHTARVWDTITGKELLTLQGHKDVIESVTFSPDGKRIVTASWGYVVKVWDAATGKELFSLRGHKDRITTAAFSPDGKRIITGSFDTTVGVWDATAGKELLTLRGDSLPILSVVFSPDGKHIASGGLDDTAKVWLATNP